MTHLTSALLAAEIRHSMERLQRMQDEVQFRAAELAIYAARIREAAERVSAIRGEKTEDAR